MIVGERDDVGDGRNEGAVEGLVVELVGSNDGAMEGD